MKQTRQTTIFAYFVFAHFVCGCIGPHSGISVAKPDPAKPDHSENPSTKIVIRGNVGLPGVLIKGLPGDPCSDNQGEYLAFVDPNWSGEATPILKGYRFKPSTMRYKRVISNTEKQDYQASQIKIPVVGSVGLEGVIMKGLPSLPVTGSDGCYRDQVKYGWSGLVQPEKEGYAFDPPSRRYEIVEKEYIHENYIAMVNPGRAPDIREVPQSDHIVQRCNPLLGRPIMMSPSILAPAVVIIPGTASGTTEFNEVQEDLRVMALLLQQAIEGPSRPGSARDPNCKIEYPPASHIQALYLHDYGVVFISTASLLPTEDLFQDLPDGDPNLHTDPVWEQTRQWLWPNLASLDPYTQPWTHRVLHTRLRARLIGSLRYASNIRHLEPHQWVSIHLTGGDLWNHSTPCAALPVKGPGRPVATLNVQKCHIDALVSGAMDEHLFQDYVQVLVQ